jgi:hypothetical protein
MRSLTVALVLSALAPVVLAQPAIVRPGARVRIDAPGFTAVPTSAFILSMTPDSITIGDEKLLPLSIPRAAIRGLELGGEKDRWLGAKKGTVIGSEWGAGLGLIIAATTDSLCQGGWALDSRRSCHAVTTSDRFVGFGVGVLVGAFYGAGIGYLVGSQRWDKVELPTRPTVGWREGRPALSWSLSF